MFGIRFEGHPKPVKLLLSEPFEGQPLRKDFPLMSREAKPWPGARRRRGRGGRGVILAETGVSIAEEAFSNFWLVLLLKTVAVMGFFLVVPLGIGYIEHKGLAHMQARLGPMEAGRFHGWAQLVADGVKFIQKEDIVPAAADRNVFSLAPAVAMIPYIAILVVLPLGDTVFAENLDVGIFFVLAMSSVSVIGIMMAGWSSANKFSLIGAIRAAAQLIAYELPLVIAAAAVVMQAGTLSMVGIAEAQQDLWFIIPQFPGFLIFMMAAFAELQRPPFDMPIADSEIIFGAYTEYTGLKFAFFLLAEYGGIVAFSGIAAVLYLGGYQPLPGIPIPGVLMMMGKIGALAVLLHLAAGDLPAPARGPAPALLLAGADPAVAGPDHGRGRREGGVLDGRAEAQAGDRPRAREGPVRHAEDDAAARRHAAVPAREAGPPAAHARRDRAQGGQLHRLLQVLARVPRLVHLHRRPQGDARPGGRRPRPLRRRSSIGSRSTTPSACTAGSASRSARSTRCSGARSSSTASTTSTLMTHEKERLEDWTYTVLPPPALEEGARARGGTGFVTAQEYAFAVIAAVGSISAIAVVTARNVVHAALYLVVALLSVGATFLLLGAEFAGWVQILIYVGAIVILFLFGLMLTKAPIGRDTLDNNRRWLGRARRDRCVRRPRLPDPGGVPVRLRAVRGLPVDDRRAWATRCSATTCSRSRRSRSCCSRP